MSAKYAIVNIFGRQFRVSEGDKITANYLNAEVGAKLEFPEVMLISSGSGLQVGAPTVAGATMTATIESHTRADKIIILKYLKKNKQKKTQGHRQPLTVLRIDSING